MFLSLLEKKIKILILKSLNKGTETGLADSHISGAACLKMTDTLDLLFWNLDHMGLLVYVFWEFEIIF